MLRWRREVVSTLRTSKPVPLNSSSAQPALHPIRLQVLIYPSLQFVNSTLVSLRALPDPLHRWTSFCRVWTWLTFPERIGEKALAATLCAGNHTTRATRRRLAHYFHFGPPDGSEDQVNKYCILS